MESEARERCGGGFFVNLRVVLLISSMTGLTGERGEIYCGLSLSHSVCLCLSHSLTLFPTGKGKAIDGGAGRYEEEQELRGSTERMMIALLKKA